MRALLLNQNPERLTAATRDAVTTNRSHLLTTALNAKGAALLAREFGRDLDPEAIAQLPRFHSIASVTIDGEVSRPFRLTGTTVEELFGDGHPDALADLDAAIDRNTCREPIAQTLARLDRHPGEIAKRLRHRGRPTGSKQRLDPPQDRP